MHFRLSMVEFTKKSDPSITSGSRRKNLTTLRGESGSTYQSKTEWILVLFLLREMYKITWKLL